MHTLNRTKILLIGIWLLLMLAACSSPTQQAEEGEATLTVHIPAQASKGSVTTAQRAGVPSEVTSIIIEVLDANQNLLDAAEIIGNEGTVSLSIPAGSNYQVVGRAYAGNELLFEGQTAIAEVSVGESLSVSLSLLEQVTLVLTPPGDLPVGGVSESLTINLDGLNNSSVRWLVNGVEGGNSEFGIIDANGLYTPPASVPSNPLITITVEPYSAPSFAQSMTFNLLPAANVVPIANAGADQAVNAAAIVTLDGSNSADSDGSIAAYQWSWLSGDFTPTLSNANSVSATFTAPSLQYGGAALFELVVTDNEGATGSDQLTISVNGTDQALVADAGSDQVVDENTLVTLNATGSNDPDNAITSYLWEELSSSAVLLSDTAAVQPSFTAPAVSVSTALQFRLTVTNDHGDTTTATVNITVNPVVVLADKVYFSAMDSTTQSNYTLWVTDGTEAGTMPLNDAVTDTSIYGSSATIGGKFYYPANDGVNGLELWRTDGTVAGTEMLPSAPDNNYTNGAAANASPRRLLGIGDRLFYGAMTSYDGSTSYFDYLSLNTLDDTLTTVATLGQFGVGSLGGYFYFSDWSAGVYPTTTLYRSNAVDAVETIHEVFASVPYDAKTYYDYTEVNGELFFVSESKELWKTDGTTVGTVLVKQFANRLGSHSIGDDTYYDSSIAFNNLLYFVADDAEGEELWRSDGTLAGTQLVKDLDATTASSSPEHFRVVNNTLLFLSWAGGSTTDGLWASDGTTEGTTRIADVLVSQDINYYDYDHAFGTVVSGLGLMFFVADDGVNGVELWVTDGTAAGTHMVKNINTLGSSSPRFFRAGSAHLYFAAQDDDGRAKLWRSDGTEVGTTIVKDIDPTGFDFSAFYFLAG